MEHTRDLASLGGNLAVTQSMHLGTKKKLEYNKFYILILLILSSCSYAFLYDLTCLSIIIAVQASNEAYRNIKCPYKRMSPRQNDNSIFSVLCISLLITSVVLSWTVDLILLSGPQLPAVRERYLGDVLRNHTTHQLLCGKPEFTNDENVSLFLKVQDFIIKSKRFEQ